MKRKLKERKQAEESRERLEHLMRKEQLLKKVE
jgi:hypothetical protein